MRSKNVMTNKFVSMFRNIRTKRKELLILLLACLLRIVNLNQSFWLDEAAQVIESSRPLSQQLDLAADFHPPLFHLILHFWMYLGKSEVWVRLPSVLFGVGSLILLYKLARVFFGEKESLIASLFLSISPYHIWYSQEARPYMLFVFLSLLSTLMLVKKRWILYTVSLVFCLYSLYFSPFLILGHIVYIFFIEKRHYKEFLLSLFISFLIFTSWTPHFLRQLEVGTTGSFSGWSKVVSMTPFKASILTFVKFILGKTSFNSLLIYGIILTPIFILFCWSLGKMRRRRKDKAILLFFFIPFISSIFTSFFIPIIAPQRLIFLLPFFYLILARGINSIHRVGVGIIPPTRCKSAFRLLAILFICVVSLYGIFDYFLNPYVQREQWRQAVSFVEKDASGDDIVLFVFPEPFAPYLWYNKGLVEAWGIAPNFILEDRDLSNLLPDILNREKIYLFQYLTGLTDPEGKSHLFLQSNQFKNTSTKDFPGVGFIYIYEKV